MRLPYFGSGLVLLALLIGGTGWAQQDRLEGRWQGTVQSFQGERQATAVFKKDGNNYTGTISGQRGDLALKEIKVDGDKITAKAEAESAQGKLAIDFSFTLQGETLKGTGEVNFSGQSFSFTYDLKRAGDQAAAQPTAQQQAPPRAREPVPQPLQQQSLNYFLGKWTFKWMGKESALGPGGPSEGIVTYTPILDGKFLEGRTERKSDGGSSEEVIYIGYDPEKKTLTLFEHRTGGVAILGLGDWTSPIGIRFSVPPIKIKGQTVRLKKTIGVVAAHSFTVTEELSVDGGPFERLRNGVFTKVETRAAQ